MNKWFRLILVMAVITFLTANIVLVKREDSKVSRINYISGWSHMKTTDITRSLPLDGIIEQAETEYIMMDEHGEFHEYLVKEGDPVEEGTPLFSYKSDKIDQQAALLDAEIDSLRSKRDSVHAAINDLRAMVPPAVPDISYTPDLDSLYYPEYNTNIDQTEWQSEIDKAIIEKNLEVDQLGAEITKYEKQKEALLSEMGTLSVTSPLTGTIQNISPQLKNPLVTIVSEDKVVKGNISEEHFKQVNEGMKVNILSKTIGGRLTGEISQIGKLPANDPNNEINTLYPVTIHFQSDAHELNIGYHVTANIVLEEAMNVPAAFGKSIRDENKASYIWVLSENGLTEKREVKTGLEVGNLFEIAKGVKAGEMYVTDYREAVVPGPFITPLRLQSLHNPGLKEISGKKAMKYLFIGVLQH